MDTSERATRRQDATAILVNYNSGERLGPLLDVLEGEVEGIVVVDNASSDDSLRPAESRPSVTVIRNESNRGFAAAVNQGADVARGDWIVLVNPDAHVRPGDVRALLEAVPADVAAVAPLQVDEQGRPLAETGGYEPSLARYLLWALIPARYHRRSGPWLAPPFPNNDVEVDWVSGALLGVRRKVFEDLERFDERFFLYHEDVDFARRAREAGYRILCRGELRLHHEVAHGDPARRVTSGLRSVESLALTFPGWRRRALGLVLGMGFLLRSVFGSPRQRPWARAALGHCRRLIGGSLPSS